MPATTAATLVIALTLPVSASATARASYAANVAALAVERRTLAKRYRRARTRKLRATILESAEQAVLSALSERIFPAWYGTPWAFNGLSSTPGQGAIACGTFVGTVLRDAGFNLNRVALGRLASEHIALSLTREKNLRRYSDRPVKTVVDDLVEWGPGLYMVGMDMHAGLIVVDAKKDVRFVHSSYYGAGTVVSEPAVGDNPFAHSRYRVLGRLLDREMMRKWLLGHRFVAKKTRRR